MVDFNAKEKEDGKDAQMFQDNVVLNNTLMRMTYFECICVIIMGTIQYLILKKYIQGNK